MSETKILADLLLNVQAYPWNNVVQVKTLSIFEEILDNTTNTEAYKAEVLRESNACLALAEMASQANYQHNSERVIRNGYMGFVVKLSNLIKRRAEVDHLAALVPEQLQSTEWRLFVQGELDQSNTNNNKSLGGHSRSLPDEEEEEETPIDVNMERIMARFNTYSQLMSQNSYSGTSNDDDDED